MYMYHGRFSRLHSALSDVFDGEIICEAHKLSVPPMISSNSVFLANTPLCSTADPLVIDAVNQSCMFQNSFKGTNLVPARTTTNGQTFTLEHFKHRGDTSIGAR